MGEMPTALTDNGDTVRITQANLNAPTSTSQLTIVEDTPGHYQLTCNATLQFSGEVDDISQSDHANVTIAGKSWVLLCIHNSTIYGTTVDTSLYNDTKSV